MLIQVMAACEVTFSVSAFFISAVDFAQQQRWYRRTVTFM
jgi:hypothetical protein